MPKSPSERKPQSRPPRARPTRLLLSLCLLAAVAASASFVFAWKQWTRPGMTHYMKGMEYASARKFEDAEKEWQLGAKLDPHAPECYEQLGLLYTELRRFPEAVFCYSNAAQNAPGNGMIFLELSRAQQNVGDKKGATVSARRAAELLPDNVEAQGEYGTLAAEQRDRPAALAALRKAYALRPSESQYLMAIVSLDLDEMAMAQAEQDLTPYLQKHPDDAAACYLMAVVYNQKPHTLENVRVGLDYARRALPGRRPGDPRSHVILGQFLLASGKASDALKAFSDGEKIAPQAEGVLHGLLDCYVRLRQTKNAEAVAARLQTITARHDRIAHLKHVMGFNRSDTTSGLELAHLEEEDGNLRLAQTYYMQLVRQAPNDPRTRAALSGFFQRTNRPEMARSLTPPAVKAKP